jgi:hypothetical protein
VRARICFAGCPPLLRVLMALALCMCVMLATHLRVCEQLFPAPLLRERAGFVTVRHARHICVCVGNYFQLCPSTGWRWRSSGVPCSPHKRVCEQLFPASLLRPKLALVLCVCAMLATHPSACGQAYIFSFTTSVEICFQLHCFVRELALAFSACA